jgi:hypothetical protein
MILHPVKVADPVNTRFAFGPRTIGVVIGVPAMESGTEIVPLPLRAAFAAFIIAPASEPWNEAATIYWAGLAANEAMLDNKHNSTRHGYFMFDFLSMIKFLK